MAEICKNCEQEITLNFCGNCGQKKTKRIDRAYLKDELQYTVFHMNKGFFYSLRNLVKNPGKTAREFVEGNRVNHYKPIVLVFMLSGIVAFFTNTLIHPGEVYARFNEMQTIKQPYNVASVTETMMKYYSFIMLIFVVPIMSFCTWVTYRKWGYNFWENIVINSYYYSLIMVFTLIITVPVQLLLKNNPMMFMFIPSLVSFFGSTSLYFWFYTGLYNKKSPGDVIVRSIVMGIIVFGTLFVLSFMVGILFAVLSAHK